MDKDTLLEKIKKGGYNQQQLLEWVNHMPGNPEKRKPSNYKVGDVIVHSVFKHPYILLKKRKSDWICGLMTSDEKCPEILEACQSRFFVDKYITKTMFIVSEINGQFINVYENPAHVKEVLIKLKNIFK